MHGTVHFDCLSRSTYSVVLNVYPLQTSAQAINFAAYNFAKLVACAHAHTIILINEYMVILLSIKLVPIILYYFMFKRCFSFWFSAVNVVR